MSLVSISKTANENYLGKIVKLQGVEKHPDAHSLQTVKIDFNTIITGMDAKDGDIYVYFPVECKLNAKFLSFTNSYRNVDLNADPEKKGFFEDKGRVKATKLRGVISLGYIVPVSTVEEFLGVSGLSNHVGESFDTLNNTLMLEKYIVVRRNQEGSGKNKKSGDQFKQFSRMVDGLVNLHVSTTNLRKVAHAIKPNDMISVTYKTHGTSWWVSNLPVKRKLSFLEKLASKVGIGVNDVEYDIVYGSRKRIRNEFFVDPKINQSVSPNTWKYIANEIGHIIPKGFTLYGEALGYDPQGGMIQKNYDYGMKQGDKPFIEVYRITFTNEDGLQSELTWGQIEEFCKNFGINHSERFFYGIAKDLFDRPIVDGGFENGMLSDSDPYQWSQEFVPFLESQYNEKDCHRCENKVPEEGVVVRVDSFHGCKSYKLKSKRFFLMETKQLDSGEIDVESEG